MVFEEDGVKGVMQVLSRKPRIEKVDKANLVWREEATSKDLFGLRRKYSAFACFPTLLWKK